MSVEWACGMMGYLPIYQLESRRNVSQSMASKTSLWEKKSRKTTTTENVLPCRTQWAESLIKYHPVWTKRFLINVVKHWLNHLMVSGKDSSISNNTSPQIHLCLRRKQREKQKERGSEATKKKRKLFNHAVCHKVPCKASKTCLAGLLLLFRTRFFLLESPEGFGCPVFRFFLFNTDRGLTSSGCFRFRCGFVSWFVEFLNSLRIFFSCLLGSSRDFSTCL